MKTLLQDYTEYIKGVLETMYPEISESENPTASIERIMDEVLATYLKQGLGALKKANTKIQEQEQHLKDQLK